MKLNTSPSGTVTAISFYNTTTNTRHVWVVADPKDSGAAWGGGTAELLTQLAGMQHITDVQTHDAVVKYSDAEPPLQLHCPTDPSADHRGAVTIPHMEDDNERNRASVCPDECDHCCSTDVAYPYTTQGYLCYRCREALRGTFKNVE